jgi:hypothetical protein
MALLSLVIVFSVLCVLTLWKRVTRDRQVPTGLKKLPGPIGMLALNRESRYLSVKLRQNHQ